jgi:capsular exopolysaccharide synthesis family protein
MSRIDEALKRASQGQVVGRSPSRPADVAFRRNDDFLGDYPLENKSESWKARESLENRPTLHREFPPPVSEALPPAPIARPAPRGSNSFEANHKLVVGPERSPISTEQYRRLAATLHEAQVEKGIKAVVVTSALPREGKTLTAVNLALTLSESYGRRVLLVDADLRRPSIHEVLGIDNSRGLSDVVRSERMEVPLVHVSANLAVLPAGRGEMNPVAGLSSDRMRILLQEAAPRYDWVLLDTPPVGFLPDAQVLGPLAQGVLFVIRAGSTPFPIIERAINEIGRDRVIGTVLNGVPEHTIPATDYYSGNY